MNLLGIHHIAIIASNFEKSAYFYTEILGLKVIRKTFRETRNSFKLDLALPDGTQVELFSFENPPSRTSRPEACGLRHLAFRVQSLETAIEHLKKYHIEAEAIRIDELTGKRFTFFSDPDELPLELYEE